MSRLGTGVTTDTTSTSNEIYYAGESFRLNYNIGSGSGSKRVSTDVSGYTITAKAIKVDVTGADISTAVPSGTSVTTTLTVDMSDGANGNFFVYVPTDILSSVGHTLAPAPGTPVYMAYTVEYTEGGSTGTEETRVIESDVIGFRYNSLFTI